MSSTTTNRIEKQKYRIKVSPVDVDSFLKQNVWCRAEKRVLSTATMPHFANPSIWLKKIGLNPERTKVIQKPMPFPAENRIINTQYTIGPMSKGRDFDNWSDIVEAIRKLSEVHKGEKGLIHTASYERGQRLHRSLKSNSVLHRQNTDDDHLIDFWQNSDKDMLISPSMMDGVDLPDDKCRWQVLLKVPYPSPGDPRIKFLLEERKAWNEYYEMIGSKLIQSVGRGVRHDTDYCTYYVLDESFFDVFSRASMPMWFQEAVDTYQSVFSF